MKSDDYRRRWRRHLSCFKKSVFLPLEGHVLGCRKASSCTLWSMCWMWKRRKKLTLRAKKVFYPWPFLEWRGSNDCSTLTRPLYIFGVLFSIIYSPIGVTSHSILLSARVGQGVDLPFIGLSWWLCPSLWRSKKEAKPPNEKRLKSSFGFQPLAFYDDDRIVRICIRSLSVVYAMTISLSQ